MVILKKRDGNGFCIQEDFVIEIRSKTDSLKELKAKMEEYNEQA
jgi:Uma2 family endonuclease